MTRRIHALVALAAVGAAGVTFGVLFVLARYGVDPHHDGLVFKGALDVLDGQVPLRDSYGQYGALLPVLQAAFLDVFGPTLLVLKGSAVAFYALSAALLVVLWRSMVPLVLAFGTWLLWLLSQPEVTDTTTTYEFSGIFLAWSSVYALGTSTAACVLLVVAHKRPASLIWASAASGALAGLTIHLRTPTGLMVSIGLLVGLAVWAPGSVRRVITSAMAFVGGLVVVVGVVLGWLALVGALGDWWQQIIVWPRTWASGVGEGILHFYWSFARDRLFAFIPLVLFTMGVLALADLIAAAIAQRWRGGRTSLVCFSVAGWGGVTIFVWLFLREWTVRWFSLQGLLLASIVITVVLATLSVMRLIVRLCTQSSSRAARPSTWGLEGPVPLIALFALTSFVQIYPISDPRHLYWAAAPALGLLVWVLYVASGRRVALVALIGVTLFGPAAFTSIESASTRIDNFSADPAHGPLRLEGMHVTPAFNEKYGGLIAALKRAYVRHPDAPIIGMTREPLWLTLGTNMANADKYFFRWGGLPPVAPPFPVVAEFIWNQKPLILIENWPWFTPTPSMNPYQEIVGYRVDFPRRSASGGAPPAQWLLSPEARLRPPPYRCPPEVDGCVAGPAVPGVVFSP